MKEEIKKELTFNEAFLELQKELETVGFDSENKWQNYKYASLTAINEKIKPILHKYDFSLYHMIHERDQSYYLITILQREDESRKLYFPLFYDQIDKTTSKNVWWDRGSAITYAKRYSISMMLNLVTDEDTDAQEFGASNIKKALEQEFEDLSILIPGIKDNIFQKKGIKKTSDLNIADLTKAVKYIKDKLKNNKKEIL